MEITELFRKCEALLPEVWQRKNLVPVLEQVEYLQPGGGWLRADKIVPQWRKMGLIVQDSRGVTFWRSLLSQSSPDIQVFINVPAEIEFIQSIEKQIDAALINCGFSRTATSKGGVRTELNYRQFGQCL